MNSPAQTAESFWAVDGNKTANLTHSGDGFGVQVKLLVVTKDHDHTIHVKGGRMHHLRDVHAGSCVGTRYV